jgi:hypothetical protein
LIFEIEQMRKLDLWPTTVYQFDIDSSSCEFLKSLILSNASLDVTPEDMISSGAFDCVTKCANTIGPATIIDAWIRTAGEDENNHFEVHCDSHKGSDHIGVLWITGDENMGGDLVIYDPAWRNPQKLIKENLQTYSNNKLFPFKVGTLTIFPADVWHAIRNYCGKTERISLNFAINIDGSNN